MLRFFPFLAFLLFACQGRNETKHHLPSPVYQYVKIDKAALPEKHAVYVPVYSHLYMETGTSTMNLSATLSVRNTSFRDSFYVTDVAYYGSQGELLKRYLDSAILIKPMASVEFVVEREESKGGAGANFVVSWASSKAGLAPLIQAVNSEMSRGVSFVTEGVEIK